MASGSFLDQIEISNRTFFKIMAAVLLLLLADLVFDIPGAVPHKLAVDIIGVVLWSIAAFIAAKTQVPRLRLVGWGAFLFGLIFTVDPMVEVFTRPELNPFSTVYNILGAIVLLGGGGLVLNWVAIAGLMVGLLFLTTGFIRFYEPSIIGPYVLLVLVLALYSYVVLYFHAALKRLYHSMEEERNKAIQSMEAVKKAQSQIRSQEKLATLGSISAGIAHELRNPFNLIINFAESSQELLFDFLALLEKKGPTNPWDAESWNESQFLLQELIQNQGEVLKQGRQGSTIISSILQQARSGTPPRSPENLNLLVEEAVALTEKSLRVQGWINRPATTLNLDPQVPLMNLARGDINRVLLNLLMNAYYSVNKMALRRELGYQPRISITTRAQDGFVVILVQDNGMGFPPETAEMLFTPFYTTKDPGEGTGLGLAICRELIQSYGGTITASGANGQGAVFTLMLPMPKESP